MTEDLLDYPRTEYDIESKKLQFFPAVYEQRYDAVQNILDDDNWKPKLRKIIDFGCGSLDYFKILKYIGHLNIVFLIDIDEDKLILYGQKAAPTLEDQFIPRETPLRVKIYKGSIGETDSCLLNTDVVICIEVIEHLYPPDLENLPFTIFGFMKPKLAIFTTPNVEFNVLFPEPTRLRNTDHKFEWTRTQFRDWAQNIIARYPGYSVEFRDVGPSPKGFENLGPVTQMAVFVRISRKKSKLSDSVSLERHGNYRLIHDFVYSLNIDERTDQEKILGEVRRGLKVISNPNSKKFKKYLNNRNELAIPLDVFYEKIKKYVTSITEFESVLARNGYRISSKHEILKEVHNDLDNNFN